MPGTKLSPRGADPCSGTGTNARRRRLWLVAVLFLSLALAAMLWHVRQQLDVSRRDSCFKALLAGRGRESIVIGSSAGMGSGSVPHAAMPSCSFEVPQGQFEGRCTQLRDVCVDQGSIVAYREEDARRLQQAGSPGFELIEPGGDNYRRFRFIHRNGGYADTRFRLPPIRVRPASTAEATGYLRDPRFSSCTVPIVWYPFERLNNFAHVFRDNGAKLQGALRSLPWAHRHAKLVLVTAEGLDMPAWNRDVLQPLTQLQMETWADFSSRLPAVFASDGGGHVPADWPQQQQGSASVAAVVDAGDVAGGLQAGESFPLSAEGGPQRCFKNMFVCTAGLNSSVWPLHDFGLRLVEHYSSKMPLPGESTLRGRQRQRLDQAEGVEQEQQEQQQHEQEQEQEGQAQEQQEQEQEEQALEQQQQQEEQQEQEQGRPAGRRVLRVLFQRRSSPDRQLLNVAELLERCNSWQFTSTSGEQLAASCAEVEPTSLLSGMAGAQEADVFVGVHGANMANAWFMRPGSSMIELQPFGFDNSPAHLQYPLFNAMDNETAVLWWVISACDAGASTPGDAESRGVGSERGWSRDRNLRLPWNSLKVVLETTVEVGGDMDEYRRRWRDGRWWWWMGAGGSMTPVGPGLATRLRCPMRQPSKQGELGGNKRQREDD